MTIRVGFIGLGNMGSPLAQQILDSEHELAVFDRDAAAVERMVDAGAIACDDARELAARSDVLVLCLPTSGHVREVMLGEHGVRASLSAGSLVIDHTTGDPTVTKAVAAELAEYRVDFIDAPVSGNVARAEAGTIAVMVGASKAQYERAHPVISSITSQIFHVGDVGAGHTMKLVNNLVSFAQRLVTQEALTLGVKNGIDPYVAAEVLGVSSGRNTYVENDLGPAILTGELNTAFSLGLAHKDVRLACQLGVDSGVPMFFGTTARDMYQLAITDHGADASMDYVMVLMDRLAATEVVPLKEEVLTVQAG